MKSKDDNIWYEWVATVMSQKPLKNKWIDSKRGQQVTKLCLNFERDDYNWHRSDTDTKFRAWDEEFQMMYEVKSIIYTLGSMLCVNREALFPERTLYFEDTPIMQFTGRLDKNDKEIFDGDIVKVLNSLYTVFYDSENGSFRLKPHDRARGIMPSATRLSLASLIAVSLEASPVTATSLTIGFGAAYFMFVPIWSEKKAVMYLSIKYDSSNVVYMPLVICFFSTIS